MFIAINLLWGLSTKGVDISAHVGGLAAGFLGGAAILAGTRADAQRTKRAIAVAIAAVAITAGALVVLPAPSRAKGDLMLRDDLRQLIIDFDPVESRCVRTFNGHQHDEPTAFANVIEREILPPWRDYRARFDTARVPSSLDPLFMLYRTYTKDRDETWDAAIQVLRGNDGFRARNQASAAKVDEDVRALKAELERIVGK